MVGCSMILILVMGSGPGNGSTFPMWPDWFITFNAETFGIGGVNLFTSGPFAVSQNPANLTSGFCSAWQSLYEVRNAMPGYPFRLENIKCLIHAFGLVFPKILAATTGLQFDQIISCRGADETGNLSSYLRKLSIGICSPTWKNINFGFSLCSVWGRYEYRFDVSNGSYLANSYGTGVTAALLLKIKKNNTFSLMVIPPLSLWVKPSFNHQIQLSTLPSMIIFPGRSNLDLKIHCGIL